MNINENVSIVIGHDIEGEFTLLQCVDKECFAYFLVYFDDLWIACEGEVFCPVCGGKVKAKGGGM